MQKEYIENKKSLSAISKETGFSRKTVTKYVKRYFGLRKTNRDICKEYPEGWWRERQKEGLSRQEISLLIGVGKEAVDFMFDKYDFNKEELFNEAEYMKYDWLYDKFILKKMKVTNIAKVYGYDANTISSWIEKHKLYAERFKYKNPQWLSEQAKIKTDYEIAEECQVDCATIQRYLREYNIFTKNNLYKDREWLYKEYVEGKKSSLKIASENSFSASAVLSYVNKFNFPLNRAGVFLIDNKNLSDLSKEYNIRRDVILKYKDKLKLNSSEELLEFLNSYDKKYTDIELLCSDFLGFEKFDKKVLLKNNYRPDFKLNNNLYLNVDGLYWHSEINREKKYHFNMRKAYEDEGLSIIQLRGDEVYCKKEIVTSMIKNKINTTKAKIFARKTNIKNVSQKVSSDFLIKNHLMGSTNAKHVGLFYNDKLVSVLSYKKKDKVLKIERFCSILNTVIVGGLSKLLKHLERENDIEEIHSWVDLRYGNGFSLEKIGFKKERETLGWKWTDFKSTYNRLQCRANMDERGLSQAEHAEELGWVKIYDAGQRLYIKRIEK